MFKRIIDSDSIIMDVTIFELTKNPLARRIIINQLRDLRDAGNPYVTYKAEQDLEAILAEINSRNPDAAAVVKDLLIEIEHGRAVSHSNSIAAMADITSP